MASSTTPTTTAPTPDQGLSDPAATPGQGAGLSDASNASVGDTPEGREAYTRLAQAWQSFIAWWSNDDQHHGLGYLQAAVQNWNAINHGYQTRMADLLASKADLDQAVAAATPLGYASETTDWLGEAWNIATAPFRAAATVAAAPFELGAKLGEAAANAVSRPSEPLVPTWVWWAGFGVGGWLLYEVVSGFRDTQRRVLDMAPQVLPAILPALGVPPAASVALGAMAQAAPAPSGGRGVFASLFGQRGSGGAVDTFARLDRGAEQALGAGSPVLARTRSVLASMQAPAGKAPGVARVNPAIRAEEEAVLQRLEGSSRSLSATDRRFLEGLQGPNRARAEALLAEHAQEEAPTTQREPGLA
jgi:hypothetical protein